MSCNELICGDMRRCTRNIWTGCAKKIQSSQPDLFVSVVLTFHGLAANHLDQTEKKWI